MKRYFLILFLYAFTVNAQSQKTDDDVQLKRYQMAIRKFNKANDSTTADFYYKRGGIRQDYMDLKGAITDYDKTLEMQPGNSKAYYNRGLAKMDLDLPDEAIPDFTKTIELDPMSDVAYNNRGICKYMQKDHAAAIEDYTMAIQINPRHAEAYNNRGISKIKLGSINEGCEELHKAYELGDKQSLNGIKKYCERI